MAVTHSLQNRDAFESSETLYLNDDLADVHFVFTTDDIEEKIPAHKLILSVLSPVFKAMFYGPMKEEGNVQIVDSDAKAFKEFLQFFYLSKVSLSMANMRTVTQLADKYDILKYIESAFPVLNEEDEDEEEEEQEEDEKLLRIEFVCWAYQLAHYVDHYPWLNACEQMIIESAHEVLQTDAFLQVDREILANIFCFNFKCSEMVLFNGIIGWATRACREAGMESTTANLLAQLGNCLKLIRFERLKMSEFSKLVMDYPKLLTAEEFQDIILMKMAKDYKPKIFNRCVHYNVKWDATKIINCQRIAKEVEDENINCRGQQVVSFTSNLAFHLGKIHCDLIAIIDCDLKVSITELDAFNLEPYMKPKYVYRDIFEVKEGQRFVLELEDLEKPILIKPNVRYEIRLHIDKSFVSDASKLRMWEPIIESNGLQITFHRNQSFPYDNATYGFISSLDVNLVEIK